MAYTANSINNYIAPLLSINVTGYQSPGQQIPHTHSHDNPASDTVSIPDPAAFGSDLAYIEQLINRSQGGERLGAEQPSQHEAEKGLARSERASLQV